MDDMEYDGPVSGGAPGPTPAHQGGPPPSVHNRFHPVPTHPVFSNPPPPAGPQLPPQQQSRDRTIEGLPHEYSSTPRLRSVPRPQLDPEELQDEKRKAEWWGRDELQQIPGHTVSP